MGSFIPIKIEESASVQATDYAKELKALTTELENNRSLQLSQFCSSKRISYQGFRGYLDQNGISLKSLRMKVGHNQTSKIESYEESLSGVSIKLPNQVEITISSILPSQLSNLLKSL